MEIEFFGANCFKIKTKNVVIVVDDNLNQLGAKSIVSDKSVLFYTNKGLVDAKSVSVSRLMIDSPGEYEVGDVTVTGMQVRAHMDSGDEMTSAVFQFRADSQTITVMGHVHPDISSEVTEFVSGTDVLIVPVGGNGYTLDPVGAAKVIKKTEPGVIIPSHYKIKGLDYEVPAQELSEFGDLATVTIGEPQDSYKLNGDIVDELSAPEKVIVLNVKK